MKRLILSLLALLFSLGVYSAPTINVIPNQSSYQVGDAVFLAISLSDAPDIHGGGLNISFNPTVIQAQSVVIDSVWKFATRTGVINNAQGSIADILFSNFNTVSGNLGVAIIQLTVVGNGDSALSVTESAKNPFSDDNGQVISFDVNNSFALNTQVAETPTEETPVEQTPTEEPSVAETTQQTTTTTDTASTTQTPEQTSTTSTDVATTNNNTGSQTFSSNIASVNLPKKVISDTASEKKNAGNSQVERQISLPSGSGAIPIRVLSDAEMQQQLAGNQKMSSDTYEGYNQQTNTIKAADESLLASAESVSEGQSGEPINDMQSVDMNNDIYGDVNVDSPTDYLTFVLILAILFVGFIVFKVFFNK